MKKIAKTIIKKIAEKYFEHNNHFTMKCDKCGKQPEIDENKTNKNWTVYKTNKPCDCSGTYKIVLKA
jgi:hypothetical protein